MLGVAQRRSRRVLWHGFAARGFVLEIMLGKSDSDGTKEKPQAGGRCQGRHQAAGPPQSESQGADAAKEGLEL